MREHEKWQESLEARINNLKASWQSLSQTFMSSDFLKWGIDRVIGLIDAIDGLIDHFGILGTATGGLGLYQIFKKGFAIDENGNAIGKYTGMFQGLGGTLKTDINLMKSAAVQTKDLTVKSYSLGGAVKKTGRDIANSFKASSKQIKAMVKDIGSMLAVMAVIKAISDIATWISEAGNEAETAAEKFDRISEELSGVDSELSSLESELSSVESQINALLAKDELTFADEEELSNLQKISNELEHQIELTETLQESLQKSLSSAAISAYGDYAEDTSFYGDKSLSDKVNEGKSKGSAIGNLVGLIAGAVIGYYTGGSSYVLAGAGIGSALGQAGGSFAGGNLAKYAYYDETMVREVLDNMEAERFRLEKARDEAYEAYTKDPTNKNKEAWEEAAAALGDYNTALSKHISQLSEYYNSVDYSSLTTQEEKEKYIKAGDDLDKYNIAMGVAGAKSTAFDRIFSDEFATEEAKKLRAIIEAAINSGEKVDLSIFDEAQFDAIKERFAHIGLTINDCVSYLEDFKEAQEKISNYSTYDITTNIAALSDGVTSLTDAFAEFNEQGVVSAKTLTELGEVFGTLGEDWTNYVDVMTNGVSTIEEAQEATEQLVESYTSGLFKNGGIKFQKLVDEETGEYEFDEVAYKTYLSTINQLEELGIENAKEYADALQQQAMIREAASQMARESAQKEALLAKETLTEEEKTYLATLQGKELDDHINEIESKYGIRLKDSSLVQMQYDLNEYQSKSKEYQKYLTEIDGLNKDFQNSLTQSEQYSIDQKKAVEEFHKWQDRGFGNDKIFSDRSWEELGAAAGEAVEMLLGSWLGFDVDTKYDEFEKVDQHYQDTIDLANNERQKRFGYFKELLTIAENADIDLSSIDVNPSTEEFEKIYDLTDEEIGLVLSRLSEDDSEIVFEQIYRKVKSELNTSVDEYEKNIVGLTEDIEARLNNLGLEVNFGRNFNKIVIDGFKSSLEQLGAALSESISGSGLSIDSMNAIEDIFGDLDGFDASKLFENTANGIRLNRNEFKKLNNELKTSNIDNVEDRMSELQERYKQTKERLRDCTVGTELYNSTIRDLSSIEAQIAANEELISQYKGVFSAYQEWQRIESSGQERDMYEGLIKGFENIDDEISRGWLDDGTIEFLELLTGKDLSTAPIDDLKKAYGDLDKTISKSGYSIRDFFTVNEDGESTNTGVYNFLETIEDFESELGDVIKRDENGRIVGYNFEVAGGNEAIAKTLGISEELVEIMVRASDDAGFVVDVDGAVTQISYLKEEAEKAVESLILFKEKGVEQLEGIDVNFNLDVDGDDLYEQYESAIELLKKYKKDGKIDGAIDFSKDGAQEALDVAKYLTIRLDELSEPTYMQIDMSGVEDGLREPIQKMQEFEEASNRKHLLTLAGDTEGLKDVKTEMETISKELFELDNETKLKLGIDTDWTKEQIAEELEKGEIEIPAQVEIGVQMSDDLKDIRLLLMGQLGLTNKGEIELKVKYNINDATVDSLTDQEQEIVLKYITENEEEFNRLTAEQKEVVIKYIAENEDFNNLTEDQKEIFIKYIADGGDVEQFEEWLDRRKDVEIIAKTFGVEDVDDLALKLNGLEDKDIQAIAEAIGKGDIEELQSKIDGLDNKSVQAIAEALGYSDVESLKTAIDGMEGNNVEAVANVEGQSEVETLKSSIFGLTGKTIDIVVNFIKSGWDKVKSWFSDDEGGSEVNGTANVNGTAFANGTYGKAFKRGDWRTKKTETALTGELGREIVVTPDNKWYTVGDHGAEFATIPKNSIVFNHKQTEELLSKGKATSNGGRAKALVNGTAFVQGGAAKGAIQAASQATDGGLDKITQDVSAIRKETEKKSDDKSSGSNDSDGAKTKSNGSGGGTDKVDGQSVDKSSSEKEFEETIDFVEIAISRIEREIDNLDQKVGNVYSSWSERNSALGEEINKVGDEIALQQSAAERYLQEANSVGLDENWAEKVRNGAIEIHTITDENLKEKIDDYKKWYELYLKCIDEAEKLREEESKLYSQRFKHIQSQYDGILQGYEHTESMLNEYISQAEAQGHLVSEKYYTALINNEKQNIEQLKNEQAALIAERDKAVASGDIPKYTQAWYDMCAEIDSVTQAIEEGTSALIEYNNAIRDLDFEKFELAQDYISDVVKEADFLVELMSNVDLYDDKGKLTSQGAATLGLHAQNANTYMYAADDYANKIAEIDKKIASGDLDPYDQSVIDKRREYVEAQREQILAAEDCKNSIKSLLEEGYEKELDYLQEKIDKTNEAIDSQKD